MSMEGDVVFSKGRRRSYTPVEMNLRQHIVGVAGDTSLLTGGPMRLAKYPARISRKLPVGFHKVDLFPHPDAPRLHQIGIGPEVSIPAGPAAHDVDGVGGG